MRRNCSAFEAIHVVKCVASASSSFSHFTVAGCHATRVVHSSGISRGNSTSASALMGSPSKCGVEMQNHKSRTTFRAKRGGAWNDDIVIVVWASGPQNRCCRMELICAISFSYIFCGTRFYNCTHSNALTCVVVFLPVNSITFTRQTCFNDSTTAKQWRTACSRLQQHVAQLWHIDNPLHGRRSLVLLKLAFICMRCRSSLATHADPHNGRTRAGSSLADANHTILPRRTSLSVRLIVLTSQ